MAQSNNNPPERAFSHPSNSHTGYSQEPTVTLATSPVSHHPYANEQRWAFLLTNIPPSVSSILTFIGAFYIFFGLLGIVLELILLFRADMTFIGGFVHGLLLFITGVVTLTLCRQQIYVLTSLFVLLIFQLHVTIGLFGLYAYEVHQFTDHLSRCSDLYASFSCNRLTVGLIICIVDLVYFFITFGIIIVTLVTIANARRPPTMAVTSSYTAPSPQSQMAPIGFQNPYTMNVNSTN